MLNCLRNHHSKKREQNHTSSRATPFRCRLFHIDVWVCGEPLRRMAISLRLFCITSNITSKFMEVILIISGIINIILLLKLWGTCNVINAIGDVIIFERENLKRKFIDDVEKLHKEIKDPVEFRKASLELAERYEEKQRIRSNDFKSMLNGFHW